MVEYTIDDIRGPTVAREMAQLKTFVLEKFNGAIADAEAAAAAAATAAANAILANTVKKTGEASQSIAGNVGVTGTLDAASIGSGSTPIVCGNLTAYGNVSLDDTVLQGNLSGADSGALINLAGVGSVLVPTPTSNGEAATKKYVDDALDAYVPMVRTSGNQTIAGNKTFSGSVASQQLIQVATNGNSPTIVIKYNIADNTDSSTYYYPSLAFVDSNDNRAARITVMKQPSGRCILTAYVRNADGTYKTVDIAAGDS